MTVEEERTLRKRWHEKRKRMVPEWAGDFTAFRAWADKKGWVPGMYIVVEPGKRIGPDTVRLVPTKQLLQEAEYHPIPGYSHRPCLECQRIVERCTTPCDKYLVHMDATLERAREIACRGKSRKR